MIYYGRGWCAVRSSPRSQKKKRWGWRGGGTANELSSAYDLGGGVLVV